MICSNDEDIVAKTHNDIYGELRDDILIKGMVTELQNTPRSTAKGYYDTIEAQFKIYLDRPMEYFLPEDVYRLGPLKASTVTVSVSFYRYELNDMIYSHVATGDKTLLEKIKNCIGLRMRQAGFAAPFNMDEIKFVAEYIPRKDDNTK